MDSEFHYTALRPPLIKFFECHGTEEAENAEDLAHETICRVLANLHKGCTINSLQAYAFGVAGKVLHEYRRDKENERKVQTNWAAEARRDGHGSRSQLDPEILARALKRLPARDRKLLSYYDHGESNKAAHRKKLASELGLTENALRVQVHRILKKLRDQIRTRGLDF